MVVVIVIGIIATILLDRLFYYQELAEKAHVEYTISRIKSGLRLRMAKLLIAGRAQEYVSLAKQDPMEWIEPRPANYLGRLSDITDKHLLPGNWYFDDRASELIYVVRKGEHFQADKAGRKQVRLHLVLLRNRSAEGRDSRTIDPTDSVGLELLEPYQWF